MMDSIFGTILNCILLNYVNTCFENYGYPELVSGNYYTYEK